MRQTPRHVRSGRGFGTLIGNGWLRESPVNVASDARWDPRGRSALRKCIFMPVPDAVRALAPMVSPAALPPVPRAPKPEAPIVPHRHDPARDVRLMPVYGGPHPDLARAQEAAKLRARPAEPGASAWWEDPMAIGSLLILLPPVGLAAVWSSKRYSSDARWALTVMTALTMCLATSVVIAVIAMR